MMLRIKFPSRRGWGIVAIGFGFRRSAEVRLLAAIFNRRTFVIGGCREGDTVRDTLFAATIV